MAVDWSGIWKGIGTLADTKARGSQALAGGITGAGQAIGGGLLDNKNKRFQVSEREGAESFAANQRRLDEIAANARQTRDILSREAMPGITASSQMDVMDRGTEEAIELEDATFKEPWQAEGYPSFAEWRADQLSGTRPDWEKLGFANLDDWKAFELSLRAAGKTELGGDEDQIMWDSYLARIVGQNEDIFMTSNEFGDPVMNKWAEMNSRHYDRVIELWQNLISNEPPEMQAKLMSMMEVQLGERETPLGEIDTVSSHGGIPARGDMSPVGKIPAPDMGRVTNIEKTLVTALEGLKGSAGGYSGEIDRAIENLQGPGEYINLDEIRALITKIQNQPGKAGVMGSSH